MSADDYPHRREDICVRLRRIMDGTPVERRPYSSVLEAADLIDALRAEVDRLRARAAIGALVRETSGFQFLNAGGVYDVARITAVEDYRRFLLDMSAGDGEPS